MKKLNNIFVKAVSSYVAAESDPANQKFVWSYEITITNESEDIFQLLSRYWRIIDMTARIEEIKGLGVIGLQPLIKPKTEFVYTSFCQLMTPQGTMEGYYEVQNLAEEHFSVDIPKFILSAPSSITSAFKSYLH